MITSNELDCRKDALINALAGGCAGFVTDSIFYGLDSFKTQTQATGGRIAVGSLFRGLVPLALIGSVPSFGVFFSVYESVKSSMESSGFKKSAVLVASLAGSIPASLVAAPADIIKKRIVVGLASSPVDSYKQVIRLQGARGLFTGWQLNLTKDVPFAVVKLTIYEACLKLYRWFVDRTLNPHERTLCGVGSGAVTAILTNPLDVVNTRIKTSKKLEANTAGAFYATAVSMVKQEGPFSLMKGIAPRLTIISLGSGVFWAVYANSQETFRRIVR